MEEWSCTKPCPFPSLIDPEIMKHDWTNNITGPEIFQEVKHSCLNGRKLVSKLAFETGVVTTFFDEIMSSCQVNWISYIYSLEICSCKFIQQLPYGIL